MKKRIGALILGLLLLLSCMHFALAEEAEQSNFDKYASPYPSSLNPVCTIESLPANCTLTPGEISATDDNIILFFANAWYNLYYFETVVEEIPLEETYAAEIYNGLYDGPGVMVFTAENKDAQYATILIAINNEYAGRMYWLEWDLANQKMKAVRKVGVEHYSTDDEFLSDYVFAASALNSVGGNIFMNNTYPKDSIVKAYGSQSELYKALDQIYPYINNGAPNPLKID